MYNCKQKTSRGNDTKSIPSVENTQLSLEQLRERESSLGKLGHSNSSCPEKKMRSEDTNQKEVHVCDRKQMRGLLFTRIGKTISFLFDSGSACSLSKSNLLDHVPGSLRNKSVYLL